MLRIFGNLDIMIIIIIIIMIIIILRWLREDSSSAAWSGLVHNYAIFLCCLDDQILMINAGFPVRMRNII